MWRQAANEVDPREGVGGGGGGHGDAVEEFTRGIRRSRSVMLLKNPPDSSARRFTRLRALRPFLFIFSKRGEVLARAYPSAHAPTPPRTRLTASSPPVVGAERDRARLK